MLRLPIPNYRLTAGCNFAIVQVLTASIGGISTTLYSHTGSKGRRFKSLLKDFYPWDREPQGSLAPEDAASIIYNVFRNPLTHDLGLDLENKAKTGKVKIKRMVSAKDKTKGLSEASIEKLEASKERPNMSATVTVRADATVLLVEGLYWGIRCMVERLMADKLRMQQAETFLASLK